MIIECMKGGVALANRNLQLVVIRIIASVINIVSLGVFLGLPLVVAVLYLGFDLTHAGDMLPYLAKHPLEFVSRYLGLALLLVFGLVVYLTFSSLVVLYTLGGTLGSLRNSFSHSSLTFGFPSFFSEANANFFRLLRLLSLVLFGVTGLLAACAFAGGSMALVVNAVSRADGTLSIFFRSFAAVFTIILCVLALLAGVVFSMYAAVVSVTDGKNAMETVHRTFDFLRNRPQALLFFLVLVLAVTAASIVFYSVQLPLRVVPFVSLVTFLVNTCFSSYLSVVLWGSLVTYYMKAAGAPVYDSGYEI